MLMTEHAGKSLLKADGLRVQDAVELHAGAQRKGAVLIGPNTPGVISPGKAKFGFMPSFCYMPGPLGLISRSGSLSYEAGWRLTSAGLGQTTVIGIGGNPVKGTNAAEAIRRSRGGQSARSRGCSAARA